MSRLFSFVNNPAIVLNLLSVLFAGVSVYFLCGAVYYLTNGDWTSSIFSSCTTSYFLLCSASFVWIDVMDSIRPIRGIHNEQYVCEHYHLPDSSILLLLLESRKSEMYIFDPCTLIIVFPIAAKGALVAGLSLCNQHTIVFYLAPIILAIFSVLWKSKELSAKRIGILTGMFFLGLSPYIYLIVSSHYPRKGNWGDMTSWTGNLLFVLS